MIIQNFFKKIGLPTTLLDAQNAKEDNWDKYYLPKAWDLYAHYDSLLKGKHEWPYSLLKEDRKATPQKQPHTPLAKYHKTL